MRHKALKTAREPIRPSSDMERGMYFWMFSPRVDAVIETLQQTMSPSQPQRPPPSAEVYLYAVGIPRCTQNESC